MILQAREHIRRLVRNLHSRLQAMVASFVALDNSSCPMRAPKECPPGPIFPIVVPGQNSRSLAAYIKGRGFGVNALSAPIVPPGGERIRICVHAENTELELDGLASAIEDWLNQTARQGDREILHEKAQL